MEHSTSAVNWQPVNVAKTPGELARDSLTARRARRRRGVLLPVAAVGGRAPRSTTRRWCRTPAADSEVFRAVAALGQTLRTLAPVAGHRARTRPASAIVFDWDSWWASEQDSHPTDRLDYRQEALDWYSALLALGIRADVVTTRRRLRPLRRC